MVAIALKTIALYFLSQTYEINEALKLIRHLEILETRITNI